ncbi:hypothetical protein Tco_1461921, partial [Tanacetum coccineum]
ESNEDVKLKGKGLCVMAKSDEPHNEETTKPKDKEPTDDTNKSRLKRVASRPVWFKDYDQDAVHKQQSEAFQAQMVTLQAELQVTKEMIQVARHGEGGGDNLSLTLNS